MSGVVKLKDNSPRLQKELKELQEKNKPLYDILFDIADFVKDKFNMETVVTGILRTQEEQDAIYKNDKKYQKKKFVSPHMLGEAYDLRSNTFKPEQIQQICDFVNNKYDDSNAYPWTAWNHNLGLGWHFHIQYVKSEA